MASISTDYALHVEIVKGLKMDDSFYEARESYKDDFEEIYKKAKDENVTMSNAKDFLNSLSKDELSTLQNYTLLVNEINVNSLSDEGAYNLLLHHYEKYDFDNDGFVQNGEGKMGELIPKNIPADEKQALVNTINQMEGKPLLAMALMFPPKFDISGVMQSSSDDTVYDFQTLMGRIDRILNPLPGEYRSEEILNTFTFFKDTLERNYKEIIQKKRQMDADLINQTNIMKAKVNS